MNEVGDVCHSTTKTVDKPARIMAGKPTFLTNQDGKISCEGGQAQLNKHSLLPISVRWICSSKLYSYYCMAYYLLKIFKP